MRLLLPLSDKRRKSIAYGERIIRSLFVERAVL
jgi:hypothetical protein